MAASTWISTNGVPSASASRPDLVARGGVGRDGRDQRRHAVPGEQARDEADPAHVGVPVVTAEAEPARQVLPHLVAVEDLDVPPGREARLHGAGPACSCPRPTGR